MNYFSARSLIGCVAVAYSALLSHVAPAAELADTVIIGDKEWAQVNLFDGIQWRFMNEVCALGPCSGTLAGFNMNGWTWASWIEVGDELFAPFPITMHPGGQFNQENQGDSFSQWLSHTGFNLTTGSFTPTENGSILASVIGFTRDEIQPHAGVAQARRVFFTPTNIDTSAFNSANFFGLTSGVGFGTEGIGGFFYRPVPLPPTIFLLALPLAGLMRLTRFNQHTA